MNKKEFLEINPSEILLHKSVDDNTIATGDVCEVYGQEYKCVLRDDKKHLLNMDSLKGGKAFAEVADGVIIINNASAL